MKHEPDKMIRAHHVRLIQNNNQDFQIQMWFIKNHYDCFNLISKGQAVDYYSLQNKEQ